MAAPKGSVHNPAGRPKGVPNAATTNARAAIAAFVEGNADRLNRLLDRIEEDNPAKAFDCIMSVVEYHIPKLARQELVGDKGGAIEHEHTIRSLPATDDWIAGIVGSRTEAPSKELVQD